MTLKMPCSLKHDPEEEHILRAILKSRYALCYGGTWYTMPAEVDLQTFRDALARLDESLSERAAHPENTFLRDSVILRFTFTFSQAIASLDRYLDVVYCLPDARMLSPQKCVRHAARWGLIDDCEAWLKHVENRNRVAHTHSEPMAIMVANGAPAFAADARCLLNALERGIADGG